MVGECPYPGRLSWQHQYTKHHPNQHKHHVTANVYKGQKQRWEYQTHIYGDAGNKMQNLNTFAQLHGIQSEGVRTRTHTHTQTNLHIS
jgi:hypothetical protein